MAVEADFWPPMEGGADTGKTCEMTAAKNLIVHTFISCFIFHGETFRYRHEFIVVDICAV